MRGVVSLASALSIPLLLPNGHDFPNRDIILFITFMVIIVTLVGQGLALPWVVRKVRPDFIIDAKPDDEQIREIELQLYQSALAKFSDKFHAEIKGNALIKNRHSLYDFKVKLLSRAKDHGGQDKIADGVINRYKHVMIEILEHERRELHAYRKKEGYDDDIISIIENRLDLEEERLQQESE